VQKAHEFLRDLIPHRRIDHYFKEDLSQCQEVVGDRGMLDEVRTLIEGFA